LHAEFVAATTTTGQSSAQIASQSWCGGITDGTEIATDFDPLFLAVTFRHA
jgi:hypothetical protein